MSLAALAKRMDNPHDRAAIGRGGDDAAAVCLGLLDAIDTIAETLRQVRANPRPLKLCELCSGNGYDGGTPDACPACGGKGKVPQ